jgi:hypothetical protein
MKPLPFAYRLIDCLIARGQVTREKRLHSQNSTIWLRFLEKAHNFHRGEMKWESSTRLGIQNEK